MSQIFVSFLRPTFNEKIDLVILSELLQSKYSERPVISFRLIPINVAIEDRNNFRVETKVCDLL